MLITHCAAPPAKTPRLVFQFPSVSSTDKMGAGKEVRLVHVLPADADLREAELSFEFTKDEHALTFFAAARRHWPALAWGMFMNLVRFFYNR